MIRIDKNSPKPYYEQLVSQIKQEILQELLLPGEKLPSVREMAKLLLINPNTISKAYQQLENEQLLVTVKGKGTFVKAEKRTFVRDEFKIDQLKEQLEDWVINAKHLQVTKEEMIQWIEQIEQEFGGTTRAN